MHKMGGLRKYLPITYWTSVVGTLALIGFPGFSGFFSKDALIEAVHASTTPGAGYAFWCVLIGVFVTSLYSFRLLFLVFHGEERIDAHAKEHLHESPWVVTVPLVLLAIPSIFIGWFTIEPVLFGGYFGNAIAVADHHDVVAEMGRHFEGPWAFLLHSFSAWATPSVYLAAAGALAAWFLYLKRPDLPARIKASLSAPYQLLINKYYFDAFNEKVLAAGSRALGKGLWRVGDQGVIDGLLVNGSARAIGAVAARVRELQTGYLYHYAFVMVIGLALLLGWIIWGGQA